MLMSAISWLSSQIQSTYFELMIGIFLVVGVVENIPPAVAVKAPARHYAFNVTYAIINTLLSGFVAPFIALGTALITRHFTNGLIDLRSIIGGGISGAIITVFISTVVFDFFYYWMHRTQHTSELLWQEHLLHHSDEFVNITTSGRTHILEQLVFAAFITVPTAIVIALPPSTIATIALLPTVWAFVIHANVKFSFGPFWWLLSSPQYHRVHHSIEEKHFNKNYAVWFPLWDIIFGTVYKPERGEYPRTGVEGVEVKSIVDAYSLPFRRWYGMIVRSRKIIQTPLD